MKPIIVWLRNDLRVADNPALFEAAKTNRPLIILYIHETKGARKKGAASLYWLHHSLTALSTDIEALGGHLVLRSGQAETVLSELINDHNVETVMWNRRYEQEGRESDKALMAKLKDQGLEVKSFNGNLLTEPWEIETKTGGYYKVFTPYWRAARAYISDNLHKVEPLPVPDSLNSFTDIEAGDVKAFSLLPTNPDWGSKMDKYWTPGSKGAQAALASFLGGPVETYPEDRNRPDKEDGTSKLSPHLAFGEISPRQIRVACEACDLNTETFMSEVGWREFSYVLLFHNPKLPVDNFKPHFDDFEWASNEDGLKRWQMGQTGYPFVDAGMRQLWATGWQHNRVRMVTASFLIKHLLIHWNHGEEWFWDTLVDADTASNSASWQWVAGSGADASPYFRIFNPFTQGEKFDPEGDYVRKFVPELAKLPKKYLNRPWEAPKAVLEKAGVRLGETYPKPIIDHKVARERALEAYKQSRSES